MHEAGARGRARKARPRGRPCPVLALALFAAVASLSADPSPAEGEIRGKVLNPEGQPLAGATVMARPGEPESTKAASPATSRTDETGAFLLEGLSGETFRVFVRAEGYAPAFFPEVPAGARLTVRLAKGLSLHGRLLDRSTGRPAGGATVRVCPEAAWRQFGRAVCIEARSGEDGSFTVPGIPPSDQHLEAVAPGYGLARREVPFGRGGGPQTLEWFLDPGAAVGGRVLDASGQPVAGAEVVALPTSFRSGPSAREAERVTTDEQGAFLFEGLPQDRYQLQARKPGAGSARGVPFDLVPRRDRRDLVLQLSGGASLRAKLLDPEERTVTDASVQLAHDRSVSATVAREQIVRGEDGTLTVTGLEPGEYDIQFLPDAWPGVVRKGVRLEEGKTTELGTLRLRRGERLGGIVRSRDGSPLAGAKVSATWSTGDGSWTRRSTCGPEGRFSLEGLDPEATFSLAASAEGFATARQEEVAPGREDLVFALEPLGRISGEVRLAEGGVPAAFEVRLYPGERGERLGVFLGIDRREFEDPEGRFEFDNVTPQTYLVEIQAEGRAASLVEHVEVRSGETTDLGRVLLERGASLPGRVLTSEALPIPGAIVSASRASLLPGGYRAGGGSSAMTDENGSFVLEGLRAGVYTVRVVHPDYAEGEARAEVPLEGTPPPIEIRLSRGGAIAGTVRDAAGLPLEGQRLFVVTGIMDLGRRYAITDAEGRYRMDKLEPGTYRVARFRGEDLQSKPALVREGETTVVDFRDDEGILVHGTVSRSGAPVAEAKLIFLQPGEGSFLTPKMAASDAEGRYSLRLEASGRYEVLVSVGEGLEKMTRVELEIPDTPEVRRDIVLAQLGIAGRVTDADGAAVRAQVTAVPEGAAPSPIPRFAHSDASGAYSLTLPPGRYAVAATAEGYVADHRPGVEVSEASGVVPLDFVLRKGTTLRGRVLDPLGQPVGGAIVYASPSGAANPAATAGTQTDLRGEFELRVPPEGPLDVHVLAGGWAPTTLSGVRPDPEEPLVISLRRGGSILVRVVRPDGTPLEGVIVRAVPEELARAPEAALAWFTRWRQVRPTNLEGETVIDLLAPGRYRLEVEGAQTPGAVEVEVREGARSEATVVAGS